MKDHTALFARFDTLSRSAQLLSDPLVPVTCADIPPEHSIEVFAGC
jgi:hypothetical protein